MEMVYTCQPYLVGEMSLVLCRTVCRAQIRPGVIGLDLRRVMNRRPEPMPLVIDMRQVLQ